MTQKERQLLFKDLSARLPYLVKGLYQWKGNVPFDRELDGRLYDELYLSLYSTEDSSFKPYLRPMSSMTEEEVKEWEQLLNYNLSDENEMMVTVFVEDIPDYIDWFNAHHFDYRDLIEKGLALEASEGMYKTE